MWRSRCRDALQHVRDLRVGPRRGARRHARDGLGLRDLRLPRPPLRGDGAGRCGPADRGGDRGDAPAARRSRAPPRAGTLDRVRTAGKLMVGYRADARPFSYRGRVGKARRLLDRAVRQGRASGGVQLGTAAIGPSYVAVGERGPLPRRRRRRGSTCCAREATATLGRRREVAFSIPIFPSGVGALLHADAPSRLREVLRAARRRTSPQWRASLAQALERRAFSAIAGTTAEAWLQRAHGRP